MRNKIILITGAPGVGKTETARALISLCPKKSVWLDTDKIVSIQPFTIDDNFYELLFNNIVSCIQNYEIWGAKLIVISGVVLPSNILSKLLSYISKYDWSVYGLYASEYLVKQRILRDKKGQNVSQRLKWLHLLEETKILKNATLIDNSSLFIEEVANQIALNEEIISNPQVLDEKVESVEIEYKKASSMAHAIFSKLNIPSDIAEKVIRDLIDSDIEGHFSHGLLRLKEYSEAIQNGTMKVENFPKVHKISEIACTVDGNRGFGLISREAIAKEIKNILTTQKVAIVGLKNSNHIGRLHHLAESVCQSGHIILGFVNYLGAGQKVPIWNGKEGRFCTNPIVIGIPRNDNPPIILDMSTSTVSEGKVREYFLTGKSVPEGWLINKNWETVHDPSKLYREPENTFITPLGGKLVGYKGSSLALMVDIMAGIITNAGYSNALPKLGGNGGLFISFHPTVLGEQLEKINQDISRLIEYYKSSKTLENSEGIRVAGEQSRQKRDNFEKVDMVVYSKKLWNHIIQIQQSI